MNDEKDKQQSPSLVKLEPSGTLQEKNFLAFIRIVAN